MYIFILHYIFIVNILMKFYHIINRVCLYLAKALVFKPLNYYYFCYHLFDSGSIFKTIEIFYASSKHHTNYFDTFYLFQVLLASLFFPHPQDAIISNLMTLFFIIIFCSFKNPFFILDYSFLICLLFLTWSLLASFPGIKFSALGPWFFIYDLMAW